MVEKIGHIKNPLTVIAIFAAIAEISGTTVLPFIESENQGIYIWFLMLFPVFLVGIFFLTLNFNHKVLYAPSDYKNEDNFLKSFGKATTEEKEKKLREEVEEAEDSSSTDENAPGTSGDDTEPQETSSKSASSKHSASSVLNSERHASLMANVSLAEKLSIMKLSKDMGLEFKTDVRFETPSRRKVIFDGLAIDKNKIHAVEVKLFRNKHVNPLRLDRVLLESELIASQLKCIDSKELVIHFMAVVDNPEVNASRVKERLSRYLDRYNVNVKLHVVTLDDLKNEYQYRP
ncbi:hypothetical protein [Desulfoplanes formicivorans]|uniref:Uncharacterized protein n=1 Tax=Desulfoplanes formicivorans TaxID=1592317 RepID=A0A194ADJ4_9BACT|nr:hypothetical protein [Desulfoplanes formicivorans]GAU08152.1 hypothetical protein DPF_0855 [Desulfoplanes formicivorans]